jgi:hypothetical protein
LVIIGVSIVAFAPRFANVVVLITCVHDIIIVLLVSTMHARVPIVLEVRFDFIAAGTSISRVYHRERSLISAVIEYRRDEVRRESRARCERRRKVLLTGRVDSASFPRIAWRVRIVAFSNFIRLVVMM